MVLKYYINELLSKKFLIQNKRYTELLKPKKQLNAKFSDLK